MMQFTNPVETLYGLVDLGGPVVALLLFLSVISLAVIFFKLFQFSVSGAGFQPEDLSLDHKGRIGAIISRSRDLKAQTDRREISREEAEDAIASLASAQIHRLQSGFRLLDSIAQIAPLIGLFGTVLGMISAFQALQDAGKSVDPSVLAGGIWVALLTTAVGLAVAVPTSLALTYFESRVARHRFAIEQVVTAILNPAAGSERRSAEPVSDHRPQEAVSNAAWQPI